MTFTDEGGLKGRSVLQGLISSSDSIQNQTLPMMNLAAFTTYSLPERRVLWGHLKGLHPAIGPGRQGLAPAEMEP